MAQFIRKYCRWVTGGVRVSGVLRGPLHSLKRTWTVALPLIKMQFIHTHTDLFCIVANRYVLPNGELPFLQRSLESDLNHRPPSSIWKWRFTAGLIRANEIPLSMLRMLSISETGSTCFRIGAAVYVCLRTLLLGMYAFHNGAGKPF